MSFMERHPKIAGWLAILCTAVAVRLIIVLIGISRLFFPLFLTIVLVFAIYIHTFRDEIITSREQVKDLRRMAVMVGAMTALALLLGRFFIPAIVGMILLLEFSGKIWHLLKLIWVRLNEASIMPYLEYLHSAVWRVLYDHDDKLPTKRPFVDEHVETEIIDNETVRFSCEKNSTAKLDKDSLREASTIIEIFVKKELALPPGVKIYLARCEDRGLHFSAVFKMGESRPKGGEPPPPPEDRSL